MTFCRYFGADKLALKESRNKRQRLSLNDCQARRLLLLQQEFGSVPDQVVLPVWQQGRVLVFRLGSGHAGLGQSEKRLHRTIPRRIRSEYRLGKQS